MCGIFGRVSTKDVVPSVVAGLRQLDYRGYDSVGVAFLRPEGMYLLRNVGPAVDLERRLQLKGFPTSTCGIGHTRWATHGGVSERNAHPHLSSNERVAVVHNGTIENYQRLRTELIALGHVFRSDTDTEVIPNLVQRALEHGAASLEDAVAEATSHIHGAYAVAVISIDHPNVIVAARNSSPLVAGMCTDGGVLLASDEAAIADLAGSILRLGDNEIITLRIQDGLTIRGQDKRATLARLQQPSVRAEDVALGDFETRMAQEIFTQPLSLAATIRSRVNPKDHSVRLGGIERVLQRVSDCRGITIVACGTSYYAALAGARLIESLARMPVHVKEASEFAYSDPILGYQDVVIGVSQSGETMDVIKALELAKVRGALVLGITNTNASAIARMVSAGVYLRVGPEFAVASTKAFSGQVTVFAMLAALLAEAGKRGVPTKTWSLIDDISRIPELVDETLLTHETVTRIARTYAHCKRMLFLGKGYGLPLALEGALKVTEIAYIDATAYGAGQLKHGPIALIEPGVPVVVIVPNDATLRTKVLSSVHEVYSRGGSVIAVASDAVMAGEDGQTITDTSAEVIVVPYVKDELAPVVYAPVVQMLALGLAEALGRNVDQPRNLAKSVTVE